MAVFPHPTEYEQRLLDHPLRPLHIWEQELLRVLVSIAGLPDRLITPERLTEYRVRDMLDGGMGSIRFVDQVATRFDVAEREYRDADGMPISFALHLGNDDEPYEIDAFKADFSAMLRPPSVSDLQAIASG